jgi:toxin FitB
VRYLLDTNVLSELRKGARADSGVSTWFDSVDAAEVVISVLVLGEVRQGIEQKRRKDVMAARGLERWLEGLERLYADRLLPVDARVAEEWGRLSARRPVAAVDALLAATAREYGLTLVTRNVRDFAGLEVELLNPFSP